MKVRRGFISNSSSSSFICDFCSQDVSGWDMNLEEAGMYQCKHGHTFCIDHVLNVEEVNKMIEEADDPYSVFESLDEKYCPLCQFKAITWSDLARYLMKKDNTSIDKILVEIRAKYKDFDSFDKATS